MNRLVGKNLSIDQECYLITYANFASETLKMITLIFIARNIQPKNA
jgi:hypothetical protein